MKREELQTALKLVRPCVAQSASVPILQHVCFEANRMFAYNQESAIVVGLKTGLNCALRADILAGLVDTAADDVNLKADKDVVTLRSGGTKANLPAMPAEAFIFEEPKRERNAVSVKVTPDLLAGLRMAVLGNSADPRVPLQSAVVLRTGKKSALLAYDGISLLRYRLAEALPGDLTVFIPRAACSQLLAIAEALPDAEATISVSKRHFTAQFEQDDLPVSLVGNLLDVAPEEAANLDRAADEAAGGAKQVKLPEGFFSAVQKVELLTANELQSVCELQISEKKLRIHGKGSLGEVASEYPIAAPAMETKLSPVQLLRHQQLTRAIFHKERVALYDGEQGTITYVLACY